MTICYRWDFTVSIILKSGKKRTAHSIIAMGMAYSDAHFDMLLTLKKRKSMLVSVINVKIMDVAFAFDSNGQFIWRSLSDGTPDIPENLNL